VGDLVSYEFGSEKIVGVVLRVKKITRSMWGGPRPPKFTMKLFELDGYVSEWDVWPSDKIDILNEARRFGEDQVLDHPNSVVSVWNHS
jgi:hypothetical protein